jgi:two-component system, LytTR family, sensor kinase
MNKLSITSRTFTRHLIFWCIYLFYIYVINLWEDKTTLFLDILFANLSSIFSCYASLYTLILFSTAKNKFYPFICLIISFWIAWIIRYIYWNYLLSLLNIEPYKPFGFEDFTRGLLIIFVRDFLIAVAYFYSQKSILLQKKLEEKEKKALQSELNFLRAQINPHFLQNCLNFIYSDTRKTNPNAADAVMLLSNIMRYSVADNSATSGMALLKDEISQVENVIQIHQLRFEQKLNIIFDKEGQFEHKQIVPMILLTLVENLIKYGDLNDSRHPAKIDCNTDENKKKIYFTTSNKKAYANEIVSTGLGLKNIRERLTIIWGDNFSLQKEETDDWYTVKLSMPYTAIQDNINSTSKLNLSTLNA